ncbi:hypothetical protein C8A05DRAFT_44384 [Staphylotrichum tortipilum]|uniref:Large ribosomal subunit protein uL23m n=1 Tax=Staphylotrichum tortipilum TaxID=2831512 RepID=A0AAN6RST0_9PEZI|nr:hypothetical protein C8A05DRAFT_44384 [Staphylotrichum longicolle]
MVAPLAAAAAEAVAQQVPRRFGTKQIFLPNHIIAFIRPNPRQPPNLATFTVPLQFNKLDLRDYLYHAYNVEVTAVRSFINQPAPRQKFGNRGKWYRPRSKKMMIAELVKPFVWPEPPAEKDRDAFDHGIFKKMQDERDKQVQRQSKRGQIPRRTWGSQPEDRLALKEQAAAFLKDGGWANGLKTEEDDGEWAEVDQEEQI